MAPDTPLRSVKYLNNILNIMPPIGPIKITKTDPAAKQNVANLLSSKAASGRLTSWNMVILIPIKKSKIN